MSASASASAPSPRRGPPQPTTKEEWAIEMKARERMRAVRNKVTQRVRAHPLNYTGLVAKLLRSFGIEATPDLTVQLGLVLKDMLEQLGAHGYELCAEQGGGARLTQAIMRSALHRVDPLASKKDRKDSDQLMLAAGLGALRGAKETAETPEDKQERKRAKRQLRILLDPVFRRQALEEDRIAKEARFRAKLDKLRAEAKANGKGKGKDKAQAQAAAPADASNSGGEEDEEEDEDEEGSADE